MHRILITGGSGYVGAMLVREFSKRSDVGALFVLDKAPASSLYADDPKVTFVQANTIDTSLWYEKANVFAPDIVIHTAWQIREMFGKKDLQRKWNVDGSDAVFDFVFNNSNVEKFIHFSTVASYGAYSSNSISHLFKEEEGFRKTDYLYAEEKRIVEKHLEEKYKQRKEKGVLLPRVFIIRPASITGPRGRYGRINFGLQAALSGQLKQNFVHRLVSLMLAFMPVTRKWCRQFVHEDDIVEVVMTLSFAKAKESQGAYEAYNICPPGPVVRGKDMAKAVGKKAILIHPWLIRLVFFLAWNLSLGRIPTSKGGWKAYSYPIAIDGSKFTSHYDFVYSYGPKEAFILKKGKYMDFVPLLGNKAAK